MPDNNLPHLEERREAMRLEGRPAPVQRSADGDASAPRANDLRLGERVMARLDELALITDEPGAITRLFLSPSHKAAMGVVRGWMEVAGLDTHLDAIGNVVGRLAGPTLDAPVFILGSHIDSVRDAGRYDGVFGVASAIEVVEELRRTGIKLPFAVEVVAFGDEEGVRFPATLSGSRALAGTFAAEALAVRDAAGVSMGEALMAFGCDPAGIAALKRDPARVCGYLEAHIEQGPVLEAEGLALGVVTAIAGCTRLCVSVVGEAGHAGTVPMGRRKDALAGAAAMIVAIEARAREAAGEGVVATVGVIEAKPGAVNVIPGEVRFSIDLRAPVDAVRERLLGTVRAEMSEIARERGLTLAVAPTLVGKATACDPGLVAELSRALERQGHQAFTLPSGAGHDAMTMAPLCPVVMLFLRCEGGVSHNPAERITLGDADAAIRAMLDFVTHHRPGNRVVKEGAS